MFIIVTSLFFFIIICCIIEVLRTNYQHKKRIERETDESIIIAKEHATKLHESPAVGMKFGGYKAVRYYYYVISIYFKIYQEIKCCKKYFKATELNRWP